LYGAAADYAAFGDRDKATAALAAAIEAGWIDYHSMELDPRFDCIRETETFKETLAHLTNKVKEMRRQLPGRKLASTLNQ
jgi:hypothetical protein